MFHIATTGRMPILILAIETPTESDPWRIRASVDGVETIARVVVNGDASLVFIEQHFSDLLAARGREERGTPSVYRNAVQELVKRAVASKSVELPIELGKPQESKSRWRIW
jgi:hypothetical protein